MWKLEIILRAPFMKTGKWIMYVIQKRVDEAEVCSFVTKIEG